jgi:hypothetical protein
MSVHETDLARARPLSAQTRCGVLSLSRTVCVARHPGCASLDRNVAYRDYSAYEAAGNCLSSIGEPAPEAHRTCLLFHGAVKKRVR